LLNDILTPFRIEIEIVECEVRRLPVRSQAYLQLQPTNRAEGRMVVCDLNQSCRIGRDMLQKHFGKFMPPTVSLLWS
jgi:hypothetical protein